MSAIRYISSIRSPMVHLFVLILLMVGSLQSVSPVSAVSNVATLSSLTMTAGVLSPPFASGTPDYTLIVPSTTGSITITPTMTVANTGYSINFKNFPLAPTAYTAVASAAQSSAITLGEGTPFQNLITIKCIAEDTVTTLYYTVTVHRQSHDSSLTTLPCSSSLSPVFTPGIGPVPAPVFIYTTSVSAATSTFTCNPTVTESNAKLYWSINYGVWSSAIVSGSVTTLPLNIGNNVIQHKVVADDPTFVYIYTVTVRRSQTHSQ
jgi:hypothetical protein